MIPMSLRFSILLITVFFQCCGLKYGTDKIEHPTFNSATNQTVLAAIDNELSQRPNDGELLKRKVRFLESAEWPTSSLSTIKRAVNALPEDGELFYIKARYHLEKDDLTPAIMAMRQAGRLGYLTAEYFSVYSQVLLMAGEAGEALKQANRFQQLDPNNYRSEFLRGKIFYQLGDTTAAISAFNLAFDLQKKDDGLNLLLLDILLTRKDSAGFNKVIKNIEYDDEGWLLKLAMLKYSHGLLRDANTDFKKILRQNSEFMPAILYLGRSYFEMKVYDSAIFYSRIALQLDSLALAARLIQAMAYDKQYLFSEAIEEYRALLTIDSTYQNATEELNAVYRKVAYLRQLREEKEAIPQFDLGPIRKNTNSNN